MIIEGNYQLYVWIFSFANIVIWGDKIQKPQEKKKKKENEGIASNKTLNKKAIRIFCIIVKAIQGTYKTVKSLEKYDLKRNV